LKQALLSFIRASLPKKEGISTAVQGLVALQKFCLLKKAEHRKNLAFGLQTKMHFMSLNGSPANTLPFYIMVCSS